MLCIIGSTGTGKSISISLLEELMREAMPFQHGSGSGVRVIGSAGSGEVLLDQFTNQVKDTTTNQVTDVPVNGIIKESELAAVMKRLTRNGNTMREILMDLYDRPLPVSIMSRGSGEVTARDHFMQMVTSTQPDSIRRLLTDADAAAGFLNRWVFAFGTPKYRPAITTFRADVTPAIDPLRRVRAWASQGRVVEWHDPVAAEMWTKFHDEKIHPLTMDDEAWMMARLPLLAKKLLLLFAINDRSTTVTVDHVTTVIQMWEYLTASYGVVEKKVGQGDMEMCMIALEKYMRIRPTESFTIRQLAKQSGARKYGNEMTTKAIDILVRVGVIQEVPRAKSEKSIRYFYVTDDSPAKLSLVSGGNTP